MIAFVHSVHAARQLDPALLSQEHEEQEACLGLSGLPGCSVLEPLDFDAWLLCLVLAKQLYRVPESHR